VTFIVADVLLEMVRPAAGGANPAPSLREAANKRREALRGEVMHALVGRLKVRVCVYAFMYVCIYSFMYACMYV
jgi:hypothetical protein